MFAWVDKRCRQATGLTDQLFGGKSIIFVGDPGQLPPVADKPLYHSKPSGALQEQGQLAYFMFTTVVKLTLKGIRSLCSMTTSFHPVVTSFQV